MNELKSTEVIELCKNSDRFYKKGVILFVEKGVMTYKIYNITDLDYENLKKRVYGLT